MPPTLREEIQQKKFRNFHHEVQLNLMFTANWLHSQVSKIFKEYDLSTQQYNVLRILKGSHPEPMNLLQIKSRLIDKMSDTSRMVERLRLQGYLTRTVSIEDRRASIIQITKKGLDLLERMKSEEPKMDLFSQGLNESESQQLCQLLDKLRKGASEE